MTLIVRATVPALIAPRALLLQTGDTDAWSDPKGEFLAAIAARPVFELFGKRGPATDAFPPAGQVVGDTLAYYMHAGGHGMVPGETVQRHPFGSIRLGDRCSFAIAALAASATETRAPKLDLR